MGAALDRHGYRLAAVRDSLLGLGLALALTGAASAEESAAPVGARPVGVEEVTVTARKREEALQRTPLAVSSFASEELTDRDVRRIEDIARAAPNLAFDGAAGSSSAARIQLRGVGNGDPIASEDPGVGLYVDGVYFARAHGALPTLFDVERVEVLRGPQGTLFGRSAIGGALSVVTRKPSYGELGGSAEVRAGNHGRVDTRLALNVPIAPELAALRLSVATATRDGFVHDQVTRERLSDDRVLAARGQLLLRVLENLETLLSVDHSIERRKPQGASCEVANARLPGTPGAPAAALFSTFAGQPLVGQANAFLTNRNGFLDACQQDQSRDEDKVASDLTFARDHLRTFGASGVLRWDLDDALSLRLITAWRRQEPEQRRDLDATAIDLAQSSADAGKEQQDAISQDVQVTGKALDGRLSYEVGGSFLHEKNHERSFGGVATSTELFFPVSATRLADGTPFTVAFDDPLAVLRSAGFVTSDQIRDASPAELQGIFDQLGGARVVGGTPEELRAATAALASSPFGESIIGRGARMETRLKADATSFAGYAQLGYDLTRRLRFTAGLRRTVEKRRVQNGITYDTAGLAGAVPGLPGERRFFFDRTARFADWSPMASLAFVPRDDALLYASWSSGFKSGGFNGRATSSTDPRSTQEIDPEKLTSYEVGFKSRWLDRRLLLNVAAFYTRYEDIQLTVPGGDPLAQQLEVFVINAGEAEITGAEIELRALPVFGLELASSIGITRARYTDFDALDGSAGSNGDPEDRQLPNVPTYTLSFGAAYLLPLGRLGDVRLRADWTHTGRSGTDAADSRILRKGKHGELDATFTWMLPDRRTEIALFGSNLLDREYFVNGIDFSASFGHATRFYAAPRTYGVELRRRF